MVPEKQTVNTNPINLDSSEVDVPCFKGIPYSEIIDSLLMQMGYDGGPCEGERNMALYSLVREIRYICDFDPDKIFQVIPNWGLPLAETKSTIKSAVNSQRKLEMPHNLKKTIERLQKVHDTTTNFDNAESNPVKMPAKLPRLLEILLKAFPEDYRPAVLMTAVTILGTLMTRLRAYYLDGSTQSPSFETAIIAPQASGKSFTRKLYDILTEPIAIADKLARLVERKYIEERKKAKNSKKQPEDPKAIIRLIPATASNAMILKRADYANSQHLLTYAEEIDTLVKGNKAGAWSQKSDIYRMAYDNATWGQDYMSDNSYSGMVKLYYNILCCGTPRAMKRFFNDVEDGLVSRFIFAKLPDMLGAKMPKFGKFSRAERKEIKDELQAIYDANQAVTLVTPEPITLEDGTVVEQEPYHKEFDEETDGIWMPKNRLSKVIDEWLEEKRMEFLENQSNKALETFRRRAAVTGFRAGMVGWGLCGKRVTDSVVNLAIFVANYVLSMQLAIFGDQMNAVMDEDEESMEKVQQVRMGHNAQIFSLLSQTFTKEDVVKFRESLGLSSTVKTVIYRWVKNGMIVKVGNNKWQKIV